MAKISRSVREISVDAVLIGTGLAPLVSAMVLHQKGLKVAVLNPDHDFFQENSELAMDPLLTTLSPQWTLKRIKSQLPENSLEVLRPEFPGAIEFTALEDFPNSVTPSGFKDTLAPHIRSRQRIWIKPILNPAESVHQKYWDSVEALFLEAEDSHLRPRIVKGAAVGGLFPGYNLQESHESIQAMLLPRLCDVDVNRYRTGLLEFVRERIGADHLWVNGGWPEITPRLVKCSGGSIKTRLGSFIFWTPKLSSWIESSLLKEKQSQIKNSPHVRIWEEWTLASREELNPATVGVFENLLVWAEVEGDAYERNGNPRKFSRLVVLREGPATDLGQNYEWAGIDSFTALSRLCHEFLNWRNFSVFSMKPRALLDWDWNAPIGKFFAFDRNRVYLIPYADGPISMVIQQARSVSQDFVDRGVV